MLQESGGREESPSLSCINVAICKVKVGQTNVESPEMSLPLPAFVNPRLNISENKLVWNCLMTKNQERKSSDQLSLSFP